MFNIVIPNLASRPDRRSHAEHEFSKQPNFKLTIIQPIPNDNGALSLWLTLQSIVEDQKKQGKDFFIFCEDDHQFTAYYNDSLLQHCIEEAQALGADILSGGVSWFKAGVQVSRNLFWVEKFSGLQFTVIFKNMYQKILDVTDFGFSDAADYKISGLTDKKFVVYPFISVQKEFGYSDVTSKNNDEKRVERLFEESSERLGIIRKIKEYYSSIKLTPPLMTAEDCEAITFPCYSMFAGPSSTSVDDLLSHSDFIQYRVPVSGKSVLQEWEALCTCIISAQKNDDDFVIVSFDESPEMSSSFDKLFFLNRLIEANAYGCEILLGNVDMFNHSVPVTEELFWVDSFSYSSFILLLAPIFVKILSTKPLNDDTDIYGYLSYITSHKLAIHPFVAEIKRPSVHQGFQQQGKRLSVYKKVYQQYLQA